jgi:hypothetical protein
MAKTKFPAPSASAKVAGYLYKTGSKGLIFTQSSDGSGLITTQEQMIDSVESMVEFIPSVEADLKAAPGRVYAIVEMPTRTSNALNAKLVTSIKTHRAEKEELLNPTVKKTRKRRAPAKKASASSV